MSSEIFVLQCDDGHYCDKVAKSIHELIDPLRSVGAGTITRFIDARLVDTALSYIRQHKEAGNNATLWHLARIEQILQGTDDGLDANAEGKGDA